MSGKWLCPHCNGIVRSGQRRNATLEAAIAVHAATCPAVRRMS